MGWTLAGLALALLGPIAVAMAGERIGPAPHPLRSALLGQAGLVAMTAAVLAIALFAEDVPLGSLGLAAASPISLLWGIGLAAVLIYVYAPATYWVFRRFRIRGFDGGLSKLAGLPVWYLVLAVAIGGTIEEILYRGYAIERLEAWSGSTWLAALLPLAIFGAAHAPMWGWGPAAATVVSGAIITAFYLWQRDLTANIAAHVITNFAGIVLPRLRRAKENTAK